MRAREVHAAVAKRSGLTAEDMSETISSGQPTYQNRIGWACTWMKHAGMVTNPTKGFWQITDHGRARLSAKGAVTASELRPFADPRAGKNDTPKVPPIAVGDPPIAGKTPDERIDEAVDELKREIQAELLDRLGKSGSLFFEHAVLKLLERMGYAGTLGHVEHAGKTGDGGVDGILYLDRLGLERVYVQAKRWNGASVGASVIRDFAGAMDVAGATKGVVLTTARFTGDARAYVERSPKAIRLIDGVELAGFMIEFAVGVSHERKVVLPKLDSDFFDE